MAEFITRQEYWRRCYHARRYLEYASEYELLQRMRDVMSNLTWLTELGQIGIIPPLEAEINWVEMFGHIMEEYKLRSLTPPTGASLTASLPKPTFPLEPRGAKLMRHLRSEVSNRPYLVKLGKARYLEETYRSGAWRVSPASTYKDPSLNQAQRDSELELSMHRLSGDVTVDVWDHKTGKLKASTRPTENFTVVSSSGTDFLPPQQNLWVDSGSGRRPNV